MKSLPLNDAGGNPRRLSMPEGPSDPPETPVSSEAVLPPDPPNGPTVAFRCWHCSRILVVNTDTPLPVVSGPCPRCLGWLDIPRSWLQALESTAHPFREIDHWPASPSLLAGSAQKPTRAPRLKKSGHSRGLFGPDEPDAIGIPEFDTPRTGVVPPRLRRWILPAALGGCAIVGLSVARITTRPTATTSIPAQPAGPAHPALFFPTPASLELEAREVWRAFTATVDPKAKIDLILNGTRLRDSVQRYYDNGGRDFAAEPADFEPTPLGPDDIGAGVVILSRRAVPDAQGRLVLFFRKEPTADGTPGPMKLDWESYIQEKDNRLHRFAADPGAEPETFRVILRRAHVFDEATSRRLGLQLADLRGRSIETTIVLEGSDPLLPRFESALPWGKPAYATLQLEWQPSATAAGPQMKIGRFICWQLLHVGGVAETVPTLADSEKATDPPAR